MLLCDKPEEISMYAYSNIGLLSGPVHGIVLCFHGLGRCAFVKENSPGDAGVIRDGVYFARENILFLYPYYGPWSWMNDTSVGYVDDVVDTAIHLLGLSAGIPVVATGGSMGGLSALVYTRHSAHHPVACAANCPVCDLPYHFTERRDLPRTMRLAFGHYQGSLEAAMQSNSPLHLAPEMPKVPYYIVHGEADDQVSKICHSDAFVAAMRAAGRDVTYIEVPGMKHCAWPEEEHDAFCAFAVRQIREHAKR